MKSVKTLLIPALLTAFGTAHAQTPQPVYFNSFNTKAEREACTFKEGSGEWVEETGTDAEYFGTYYQNFQGTTTRTNYLKLPEDIWGGGTEIAANSAISIGFWVKEVSGSTNILWKIMFGAYGAAPTGNFPENSTLYDEKTNYICNTWPMLALQHRGIIQINNGGWCDFTDTQNDNSDNKLYQGEENDPNADYPDWLQDCEWHYYTVTMTPTKSCVYFDGEAINSWTLDGTTAGQNISESFKYFTNFTYNCLGGNQAWDFADTDSPLCFDDFAVYATALTADQIKSIMTAKRSKNTAIADVETVKDVVSVEYFDLTGAKIAAPQKGINIIKTTYSDGTSSTTKAIR